MTNVIMCPSHLTLKWKREVERLVPNGKGYIIKNISDLIAVKDQILDKHKKENMYLILSKDTAKFSYETRPCAIWSETKKAYICPVCGQVLTKRVSTLFISLLETSDAFLKCLFCFVVLRGAK